MASWDIPYIVMFDYRRVSCQKGTDLSSQHGDVIITLSSKIGIIIPPSTKDAEHDLCQIKSSKPKQKSGWIQLD
jgi:hypothetical protein